MRCRMIGLEVASKICMNDEKGRNRPKFQILPKNTALQPASTGLMLFALICRNLKTKIQETR
jgi:hypothetical protein